MTRPIIALLLALPLAADAATDPVIFDNGEPDFSRGSGAIVMSNDPLPADDFIVDSAAIGSRAYRLTDAHFLTSQVGSGTGTWDGQIRWYLFSGDSLSPKPGDLLASGLGTNVQRDFVRILTGAVRLFTYSFDFDVPLSLEADTVYWLALNMGPTDLDIAWMGLHFFGDVEGHASVRGAVSALPDPGPEDWRVNVPSDRAFFLTGFALSTIVDIDIKPGSDVNRIHPFGQGVVPVAILGSDTFDVLDVDVTTLAFGPAGAMPVDFLCEQAAAEDDDAEDDDVERRRHRGRDDDGEDDDDDDCVRTPFFADVNRDGFTDLVSHYQTEETGIAFGATEACLAGETLGGTPLEGCDAVLVVLGECGLGFELVLLLPAFGWLARRRMRG